MIARYLGAALLALVPAAAVIINPLGTVALLAIGLLASRRLRQPVVFALALVLALCLPAMAQTVVSPTAVSIPIGDWIGNLAQFANGTTLISAIFAWLFRKLPANMVAILKTMQAEQLLQKGISYALNAVAGATAGKVLTVDVANQVLAEALNYILSHAPAWLINWLGGEDAIAQKIIARLSLDAGAAVVPTPNGGVAIAAMPAA